MSTKEYYINGEWLTWDEVHNLGYTLTPAELITVYDSKNNEFTLKKDTSDNTYYDSENKIWLSDITDLGVYKLLGTLTLYTSEVPNNYTCYANSELSDTPTHILYNSNIISLDDVYNNDGITQYSCSDYTVNDGNILVWYDNKLNKYWDNRTGKKEWLDSPPTITNSEPQNWTPPSFITIDFDADFAYYTESEPLKINATGRIPYSYESYEYYDDLKFIDSLIEDYELFVSNDEVNENYVLYNTEDITYNGINYSADTKFILSKYDYYEDIEGTETFYYLINNKQYSEVFYYRTDFENHIGERIYFNESNLPETYDYYHSNGHSRLEFTDDTSKYIIINNELVNIKINDNLIYSDGEWLTLEQYKLNHDVYKLESKEQLYHDNSRWYIDYRITSGTTSGFRTSSDYRKLLYNSSNEVFIADPNYIYAWDNTMDTTSFASPYPCVYSISNLSNTIQSSSADRKYLLQVFREDADPLNPLSGTSTNLIAYCATDVSANWYWDIVPTIIVCKFSKVM